MSLITLSILLTLSANTMEASIISNVTCGSTDFNYFGIECLNSTHYALSGGTCTNGLKLEQDLEIISCSNRTMDKAPHCHQCGIHHVCSSSTNSTEACSDFESNNDTTLCGSGSYSHIFINHCTSEHEWYSSEQVCRNGDHSMEFERILSCEERLPGTPTCLDCGALGVCAEAMATCDSLGLPSNGSSGAGYQCLCNVLLLVIFSFMVVGI